MSKNTEAITCFILFTHKFFDRSYGSYMIQSSDFDKIKFEIQKLKNTKAIFCFKLFFHQFFDRSYGSYMI